VIDAVAEAHPLQHRLRSFAALGRTHAAEEKGHLDVFLRADVWQ